MLVNVLAASPLGLCGFSYGIQLNWLLI